MEKASFDMKLFVLLLVASSMMLMISVVPGTEGQGTINLPCNTTADCQAIDCQGGAAVCSETDHRCHCINDASFGTETSCRTSGECNKKCDPRCTAHSCVNGKCVCGC